MELANFGVLKWFKIYFKAKVLLHQQVLKFSLEPMKHLSDVFQTSSDWASLQGLESNDFHCSDASFCIYKTYLS